MLCCTVLYCTVLYCTVLYCVAGAYSCLRVRLLFARQLSFFLVTVYVPCSMTVSVSWMSFWLDHKAVSKTLMLKCSVAGWRIELE